MDKNLIYRKIWNKKIQQNALAASVIWLLFSAIALLGWLSIWQNAFNRIFLPADNLAEKAPLWWVPIILFFEGACLTVLINNIKPAFSLIVPFGLLVCYFGVWFVLLKIGTALDLFFAFFFGMLVYLVNIIYNFLAFDAERKKVRRAFEFYLAPEYIEQVADDPDKLKLGGETKELTVFFSDIRSFSSIAEKMSAQDLVSLLNEYFTAMTDIIMAGGGVVDKYIGDAIMAFWGAPIENKDHAAQAVRSSLKMVKKLAELNQVWRVKGFPEIKIGMGLNTSLMVVGNIGSERRFNYTVMGDGVNLASRLEGLTKYYGSGVIISEDTFKKTANDFCFRQLDVVAVKGKEQPVKIFEALGTKETVKNFAKIIELSDQALGLYFNKRWKEAIAIFEELARIDKNEIFVRMFISRCQELMQSPPANEWDGVWQMKEK